MSGCIEEGDLATLRFNRVRTNMLCNTACFAVGHLGSADIVEQRCLTVIYMPHDGDNRRSRQSFSGCFAGNFIGKQLLIHIGFRNRLGNVTKLFNYQCGSVLINNLVDRDHGAHVEQDFYNLVAFNGHALREIRYGNILRHFDFANDRCGRLFKSML